MYKFLMHFQVVIFSLKHASRVNISSIFLYFLLLVPFSSFYKDEFIFPFVFLKLTWSSFFFVAS